MRKESRIWLKITVMWDEVSVSNIRMEKNLKHLSCWHLYRSLFAICISLYFTVNLGLKCTLKLSWIHKASTIKIHAQSETLQNFNEAITKFKVKLVVLYYFVMKVLHSTSQMESTATAPMISKHGRHTEPNASLWHSHWSQSHPRDEFDLLNSVFLELIA